MFGCAVTKIDFEWIDIIKFILAKNKLKVKWFIFGYFYVKMNWTINL